MKNEEKNNYFDDKFFAKKEKDKKLEEEYKQGIKYQNELENKTAKTRLF